MTVGPPLSPDEADDLLAAEYALGVLSDQERNRALLRVATEPVFAARVAEWEARLLPLADDVPPVRPPARTKALLDMVLFREVPRARRRAGRAATALVALAAGVALALGVPRLLAPPGPDVVQVATLADAAGEVRLHLAATRADAAPRLVLAEGAVPAGRALEVWLLEGDAAPVSVGLLAEGAAPGVTLARALPEGATLAVSVEPPGGSPTGAPTGAVLATGLIGAVPLPPRPARP